jgi:hypothetical protein
MSSGLLRRIAVALGVLVVMWLTLRVVRDFTRQEGATLPPVRIDTAEVDTIRIERPADTIQLTRDGASWSVNGYPAIGARVAEALDAATDTTAAPELVAENPTSHQQLGLDSAQARSLTILTGPSTALTYLVGKRGASFASAYIRRPGRNNVFQVNGTLVDVVERSVEDWRDRTIVRTDPDSLGAIEVEWKGGSYRLTRRDTTWVLGDNLPADAAAVNRLTARYRTLETNGFVTAAESDSADFAFPDRRVRLLDLKRQAMATLLFDSTASGFWVRRDTVSTVFRLDRATVEQLTPPDSTLQARDRPSGG